MKGAPVREESSRSRRAAVAVEPLRQKKNRCGIEGAAVEDLCSDRRPAAAEEPLYERSRVALRSVQINLTYHIEE